MDVGAEGAQFFFEFVIAAIYIVDIGDFCLSVSYESCYYHSGAGTNVAARDGDCL